MPYDPHTSNFYRDKNTSVRNRENSKHFASANDTLSATLTKEKLQLYYVGGRSMYKAWKSVPNFDIFLPGNQTKYIGQVVAIYISAGTWDNIESENVGDTLANIIRVINRMLRPGGKFFLVLKHATHLHLVETALVRIIFVK